MNIETLLGETPKSTFLEEYFHRLPFSRPGGGRSVCSLGTWDVLTTILGQQDVDMMVARQGQQYDGADPTTPQAAQALNSDGYTILVRHAERHYEPLRQLADAFKDDFCAPINVHVYATPAGEHGFSWHYDAENVFIMQTNGEKEYFLRKNTVHPWPLAESIPDDMRYQHEIMPLTRVTLSAGDWLYVPCGYWHKADARDSTETSISIALGVMSPSAIDVYDFLRHRLLNSLLWRQRLPVDGSASPLSATETASRYQDIFDQLADDLGTQLRDDAFLRDFLSR